MLAAAYILVVGNGPWQWSVPHKMRHVSQISSHLLLQHLPSSGIAAQNAAQTFQVSHMIAVASQAMAISCLQPFCLPLVIFPCFRAAAIL